MKILVYAPSWTWGPAYRIDLRIIAQHLNAGDEVHVLRCTGDLGSCYLNPNKSAGICYSCNKNAAFLLGRLEKSGLHEHTLSEFLNSSPGNSFSMDLKTIEELRKFTHCGVDIGMSVLSSLVSLVREPNPDLNQYQSYIQREIGSAIQVYEGTKGCLEMIQPDLFYVFNGRVSTVRPALRAAQQLQVETYVHEVFEERFNLTKNVFPHDIEYVKNRILSSWGDGGGAKQAIASQWFSNRRNSAKIDEVSNLSKNQTQRKMPQNFDRNCRNISIFVSSEDEFVAIEGYENPFFSNQLEAVKFILETGKILPVHFWIRIHPFLRGIRNSQVQELLKLRGLKNVTVVAAEEDIDSYALMESSEKIITFGSTMGAEACFWGVPSVLIGRSIYENLDCCYSPKTKGDIPNLIDGTLAPISQLKSLPLSHWFATEENHFKIPKATEFPLSVFEELRSKVCLAPAKFLRGGLKKYGGVSFWADPKIG